MLIGSDGEKIGLLAIDEALDAAQKKSLDLVQVSSSDAEPVVCKLLDYGKHLFDKKKSISSSKLYFLVLSIFFKKYLYRSNNFISPLFTFFLK